MTDLETIDLPPELTTLEARLAQFRPQLDENAQLRLQTTILEERCRLLEEKDRKFVSPDNLVETFKRAEKEEISLSLNRFLKSVRLTSALTGGMIGFLLGTLLTFAGIYMTVHLLTPETVKSQPLVDREALIYFNTADWHDLSRFSRYGINSTPTLEKEATHGKQ